VFSLSTKTIDWGTLRESLQNPGAGALSVFEGWVRDHHEGRQVVFLEYEAFASLAQKEGGRIIGEAKESFEILEAVCVHRVGRLDVGELAVWIGVSAQHRDAAFKACRYLIDQTKARLPIWKREHYEDGSSVWVNCESCSAQLPVPEAIKLEK